MTREWVSEKDHNWVMTCDQTGCGTRSEPYPKQPDLVLFQECGWFVAATFGDICPTCLERGIRPSATVKPYRGIVPPIMRTDHANSASEHGREEEKR